MEREEATLDTDVNEMSRVNVLEIESAMELTEESESRWVMALVT